jgi:DNA mismatch repair protein MutS2
MLKTVGLLTLMSLCGLHIPAGSGTVIPYPNGIYVDIGDEQSIENDLSTFSSHVVRLIEILQKAGRGTMVLLDEVGVGTDPVEGIAIARAILEDLNARDSRTIATTHYSQLKGLADGGTGIVNGSLSFDPEKLIPTFRFSKGLPGRSMGLSIGERLGLPVEIITIARSYLDEKGMALEDLLGELEKLKQSLVAKELELDRRNIQADKAVAELREQKKLYNQKSLEAARLAREESKQVYLKARRELEDAIRKIEGGKDRDRVIKEARRILDEGLRSITPLAAKGSGRGTDYIPRTGDSVMLLDFDRVARVVGVSVDRGEVEVEMAGKCLKTSIDAVIPLDRDGENGSGLKEGKSVSMDIDLEDQSDTVDIRGCTRDEVGFEISRAIDNTVLNGLTVLKVIHGKGTGVLRVEVSRVLVMDKRVKAYRMGKPWEGGSGVTIVEVHN